MCFLFFSCWLVVKDTRLFRYTSPIDDSTEDVMPLGGYEVMEVPKLGDKNYIFELLHTVSNCGNNIIQDKGGVQNVNIFIYNQPFCSWKGDQRLIIIACWTDVLVILLDSVKASSPPLRFCRSMFITHIGVSKIY